MGKKKIHYAWVICFAGMLIVFASLGVISNGFAIYLPYLIKEFNLTNGQNSSLMTARWVTTFLSMLFCNKFYEKMTFKWGTAISVGFAALSHFMYSWANSYTACLIASLVMGFGYGLGAMIPTTILISKWFKKSRQLALGLCATGSSVAVIFLPRILTAYMERTNLQSAFRVEGILLVIIAIILLLIVRDDPEKMGLKPYGYEEACNETKLTGHSMDDRPDLSKGMWMLLLIVAVFVGASANPTYSHITINYTAAGYSKMTAATYYSATGLILAFAKIICGKIGDKQGGLRTSYLVGWIQILGYVLVSLAPLFITPINYLAILFVGLRTPFPTMVISLWANDISNTKQYAKVVARMQIMYSLGSLAYSSVPGIIADQFDGIYSMSFIVSSIIIFLCMALITVVYIKTGFFKTCIQRKKK